MSATLLNLTECLIFCGSHSQGQGVSWDESLRYAHQLTVIHPWTGYTVDVVALQRTLKEAQHDMQITREFTHEQTKQHIAHLKVIASCPTWLSQLITPTRGCGLTHRADHFFIQEQLRDLQVNEPAFGHQPALLADRLEIPDPGQYDSTHDPDGEGDDNDEDTTSQLGGDPGVSTGNETNVSGWSNQSPTTECDCCRNHTL